MFHRKQKKTPLCSLSVFSYIPPRRNEPKEMTYFKREARAPEVCTYDRLFHQAEGYDNKVHRDDREHSKGRGFDIFTEEISRVVPVRSSSEYGRRPPPAQLLQPGQQYARVATMQSEFFKKNGITWSVAEGYGSVVPV
ncbi:uncharacterized protein C5orf49 homolog [Myripristis murdjan]|uniref:uncharacterized protein C5orf49 homolog n=1 Tax=Myripristis murdjan TaxID=586833 RepID=UPI0011761ED8|nr:uncharacterized protein C5orf49 homolog [Myripristis murdjan]